MEPLNRSALRWFFVALVALLAVGPLSVTVMRFASDMQPGGLNDIFAQVVLKALGFTVAQAAVSSAISSLAGLTLGTGIAFWPGTTGLALTHLCEAAGLICFVLPGVTVSLLVLDLHFGFEWLPGEGLAAVALAHLILNGLFIGSSVARRVRGWLAADGIEMIEAAALLGVRGCRTWGGALARLWFEELRVWVPLVFLWSFSAFATLLMLGGGPSHVSLEVLLFFALQNDADTARILVLMVLQAALGSLVAWASSRRSASGRAWAQGARQWDERRLSWMPGRFPLRALTVILLATLLSPVLWLLTHPLMDVLRRNEAWAGWEELAPAFAHSLTLASLTSAFSLAFACLLTLVDSKTRRALFGLAGLSTTLLAAAWSGLGVDLWLEGHAWGQLTLAALALAFVQLPLSAHWIENRFRSIPSELFEAAALLGARPTVSVCWIAWPLLRDVFLKIGLLAFVGALGELAFVGIFLSDIEVASTVARRLASRYDFAAASMVLLFMLTFTLVGVALDIGLRQSEERGRAHG